MANDTPEEPNAAEEPQTAEDYSRRGWNHLAAHANEDATADFHTALSMNPKLFDAVYGLGMALKAQNQNEDALQAFDQAIELLDDGAYESKVRALMMKRIVQSQRRTVSR